MYTKRSRIVTANQLLLAVLVLAIYVTKWRNNRMVDSDFAVSLHAGIREECNVTKTKSGLEHLFSTY